MQSKPRKVKRMHPVNPDNLPPELEDFNEVTIGSSIETFFKRRDLLRSEVITVYESVEDYDTRFLCVQTLKSMSAYFKLYIESEILKICGQKVNDLQNLRKHILFGYKIKDDYIREQTFLSVKESFRYDLQNLDNLMKKFEDRCKSSIRSCKEKAQLCG